MINNILDVTFNYDDTYYQFCFFKVSDDMACEIFEINTTGIVLEYIGIYYLAQKALSLNKLGWNAPDVINYIERYYRNRAFI